MTKAEKPAPITATEEDTFAPAVTEATDALALADAAAPVVESVVETRAVEEWALAKGHIMAGWDARNRYISLKARTFVPQDFNVAKCIKRWGAGHQVTEAAYDAALIEAARITSG